jgi:Predicted metal-dependent hydrolase of the TIM-barrel fold
MDCQEQINLFDCNCSFGARGVVNPGSFWKVQDLVQKMNRIGIEKALVYHSMAKEYNPMEGNRMLMEEIKQYPSLVPSWVVMPHATGEFPAPDELAKQLTNLCIKAVRIFPSRSIHNFSTSEWNCGMLFDMLQTNQIPLFIDLDQISLNDLDTLLKAHPTLKVVITAVDYDLDRSLYSLLGQHKNLYVETSGYKVNQGIETLCGRFGVERILFGSGMPLYSGAAAVSTIRYSRLCAEGKNMIASKNLENLLGGVRYE